MCNRTSLLLTHEAVCYAWRQLALRAGICGVGLEGTGLESVGVPVFYDKPDNVSLLERCIIVVPTSPKAFERVLSAPAGSLSYLPISEVLPNGELLPLIDPIPVLFWGERYEAGAKPFAAFEKGRLIFYADIIAATLVSLSRWEETVGLERDEHDRFPAHSSIAFRQGFLDRPVIDEYGLILRAWLQAMISGWRPEAGHFEVKLTHDIDKIRPFRSSWEGARILVGDLLKRHSMRRAKLTSCELIAQCLFPLSTSQYRCIHLLAGISEKYKTRAAFYFMAGSPGRLDSDYDIEASHIRRCIDRLQEQGFEIGFHPSYNTHEDPALLESEKERMDRVLGHSRYGGRQHFLRFAPSTWRHWERLGLVYDSTLGYAEQEGFRAGTCHPFHPFDLDLNRELDIVEIPLIVMDATLRRHRKLDPQKAEEVIKALMSRCKAVGGTFTLLWHNGAMTDEGHAWLELYERTVGFTVELDVQRHSSDSV